MRRGLWNGVCAHPEGVAFVWQGDGADDHTLTLEINEVVRARLVVPMQVRYLPLAANPKGDVMFIGQGQDDGALYVGEFFADGASGCEKTIYECITKPGLRWDGMQFVIFLPIPNQQYQRIELATGNITTHSLELGSQGFLQVDVDGREEPRSVDLWRTRTIRGTSVTLSIEANGRIFGQGGQGGFIGIPIESGDPFLAMPLDAMMPSACYSPVRGIWAVSSWDAHNNVGYAELPPFPPLPTPPPPTVHVEPIDRRMNNGVFGDPHHVAPANVLPLGPDYPAHWLDLEYAEDHGFDVEALWRDLERPGLIYAPPGHRDSLAAHLRPSDVLCTPFYRRADETLGQFVNRVSWEATEFLAAYPENDVELVCGATVDHGVTEAQILEGFPVYRDLAELSDRIIGWRWFSWAQNAGGAAFYPSFKPWLQAFKDCTPGPHQPTPIPPPVVTSTRRRRLYV